MDRLGLRLPPTAPFRKAIWVHALSVGEVLSSVPLIRAIKEQYPSKEIVLTVTTSRGMEVARKELQGEVGALLTMPLDFWWSMKRMMRYIDPALFLLVETDLWPGLIHRLRKQGIPALLLNGRISPRTNRSYRRFGCLARNMLGALEVCLMQSDLDRERLLRVGMDGRKVITVGNIKFDRAWRPMESEEKREWMQGLHLEPKDRIWVAGSTHRGEEEIILEVFSKLRHAFPGLRLILAPRRIERAPEVQRLVSQKGTRGLLRSALAVNPGTWEVLVMDTMGELGRVYGIGELSFVGGSLVPIGGHNLLEPASFGRPVLFGPHTHNFVLMAQLLLEAGGGKRVANGEDLLKEVRGLLTDPGHARAMGRKAKAFVDMNRGALVRVMSHVCAAMESGVHP